MFVIFVHYFLSKFCLCIAHFTPWEHSSLTSARAETKIAHVRCRKSIHVQNLEVIEECLEFLLIIKGIYLSPVTKLTKNALPPARLIVTHFQLSHSNLSTPSVISRWNRAI